MDIEGLPAAQFVVVLYPSLNQLHILFSLVMLWKAPKYCEKVAPSCFLLPCELLGKFPALQDLLYLWSNEDAGFDPCLRQLREEGPEGS